MSLSSYMQHLPTQSMYLSNIYCNLTFQACINRIIELAILCHLFVYLSLLKAKSAVF